MDKFDEKLPNLMNYYKHAISAKDYDVNLHYNNRGKSFNMTSNVFVQNKAEGAIIINQKCFLKQIEKNYMKSAAYYKDYLIKGYRLYTLGNYVKLVSFLRKRCNLEKVEFERFDEMSRNHDCFVQMGQDEKCFQLVDSPRPIISMSKKTGLNEGDEDKGKDNFETDNENAFYSEIQANQKILANMFALGDTKNLLLLGHDNNILVKDYTKVLNNIVDITSLGKWKASSEREENPISNILDNNIHSYWQSDGFLPHFIDVEFDRITKLNNIMMFFSNKMDQSYFPSFIKIYGGTHDFDMVLLRSLVIKNAEGWINLFFYSDCLENKIHMNQEAKSYNSLNTGYIYNPPIDVKILKFTIFTNQQKGKDSHLRFIRLIRDNNTNNELLEKNVSYNNLSNTFETNIHYNRNKQKEPISEKRKLNSYSLELSENNDSSSNNIGASFMDLNLFNNDVKLMKDFGFL